MNTMKKIITVITGLSLGCVGLVWLTGCDASFDNSKQETQQKEIRGVDLEYSSESPKACQVLEVMLDENPNNDQTTIDSFLTQQGGTVQKQKYSSISYEAAFKDGSVIKYSMISGKVDTIEVDKNTLKQNIDVNYSTLNAEYPQYGEDKKINRYSLVSIVNKFGNPYLYKLMYSSTKGWLPDSAIYIGKDADFILNINFGTETDVPINIWAKN